MNNATSLMTYPFSWHDGIVQHYLSSFLASSTWDKNPSDSGKRNISQKCNSNFPKNQFVPCQSSCVLKQPVQRSWTSESSNLIWAMKWTWLEYQQFHRTQDIDPYVGGIRPTCQVSNMIRFRQRSIWRRTRDYIRQWRVIELISQLPPWNQIQLIQ
jgi:hypothetical protein